MSDEAFIEFLRKVAGIETFIYYENESGQVIGESRVPPAVIEIVDAAKDALKKMEKSHE